MSINIKRFIIFVVLVAVAPATVWLGYKYQQKRDVEKFMNSIYKTPQDLEEKYGVKLVEVDDWEQQTNRPKKKDEKKRLNKEINEARKRLESKIYDSEDDFREPFDMRVVITKDKVIVDNYSFVDFIMKNNVFKETMFDEEKQVDVVVDETVFDWEKINSEIDSPMFIHREISIEKSDDLVLNELVDVASEITKIIRNVASINPMIGYKGKAIIAVGEDVPMDIYRKVMYNLIHEAEYQYFNITGKKNGEFHSIYHRREWWTGHRPIANMLLRVNYSEGKEYFYLSGYDDRSTYLLKSGKGELLIENSANEIDNKFVKPFVEDNVDETWLKKVPFEFGSIGRIITIFDDLDILKFKDIVPFMKSVNGVRGVYLEYCNSGDPVINSYGTMSFDEYKEKRKGKILIWHCLYQLDSVGKWFNGIDCKENISTKDKVFGNE